MPISLEETKKPLDLTLSSRPRVSIYIASSIDAVVMGRHTYEVVAGFNEWAYKDKRVIVLSHTLTTVRKEAELFTGQISELLAKLHAENIKHIWIDGGMTVSRFLEAGLVDDMTISIIAMVLGSGIPLFSTMNQEHNCHLVSAQSYPSGLVQLKYEIVKES